MFPIVDAVLATVNKAVDKFIPDANIREQVKLELATQAMDLYKMEASDRESARRREADTKDSTTSSLAWVYTAGYFGMLAALLGGWVDIPASQDALLDVLMGVLTAGQYSIMAYYFGSSHGSAGKDGVIRSVLQNGNGKS